MYRLHRTVRPFAAVALCIVAIECSSDQLLAPLSAPTLSSIGAASGVRGTTATLALTGTNFVPRATTVEVSGGGVTTTSVTVASATSASASLAIDANAALGVRNVTVETAGGTSAATTFTVNPPVPTLATVLPAAAVRGMTQTVTLAGTNFVTGATTVVVSGTGVTVSNVNVTSASTLTANVAIDASAAIGDRTVTISTAGGTSGTVPLSITPQAPTLASLSPTTGVTNTVVNETLTGANFVGNVTVLVSGAGVTATNTVVVNDSTITAQFVVVGDATLGTRTVTIMTAGGMSGGVTFTVNPPAATVASITPNNGMRGTAVAVSITGSNFIVGATSVAVAGPGVAVSNVVVTSSTALTATFTVDTAATLGLHDVSVITAGGSVGVVSFTVNAQPPTVTNASTGTGQRGQTIAVTITGTGFVQGGTTVNVSGAGVTVSTVTVTSPTSLTVLLVISATADLGSHDVTVTTGGGTSFALSITITAPSPTLTTISPSTGGLATAVGVTLTGTNFDPANTTVSIDGTGVTSSAVSVVNGTSLTATFTVDASAALGARNVTVTTAGGTSASQTFTVTGTGPTLTSLTPTLGVQGNTVAMTLTGTAFVAGGTTVAVDGTGVAVNTVNVTSGTSLTANFVLASGATLGAHNVKVTTSAGTSAAQTFTVNPPLPTLASISPNTGAQGGVQTITVTGTNFVSGATTVEVSGTNVTVSNVSVASATSLTADFTVAAGAVLGARDVTVMTAGGTSSAQTFTIVVAPTITTFDALATHLQATQPSRLRWTTSNAATCTIDNGVGTVTSCNDSLFVTPGTTKTYTLTATSAGASTTATFQLFANEPGRFVYSTSSNGANTTHVHQFSLDATTGDLTAIGSGNVSAGGGTEGIAADPAGKFVYVTNNSSNNVQMYSIDQTTGALTSLGTVGTGTQPREIAVDPTGRFAYVVNNNGGGTGSISRYTIDGSTGLLTANGTTPIGTNPQGIAIERAGRFLYATNFGSGSLQEFAINADGSLTSIGTVSGLTRAFYLTSDPGGRFLYVTTSSAPNPTGVAQYKIESDGTLTLLTPLTNLGGTIDGVAVDATSRFAYALDFNNCILHEFTVDQSTGILTQFVAPTLPHAPNPCQNINPFAIALDPQGKFAYMTNQLGNTLGIFAIDATTGALSPVTAPLTTIAAGTNPWGVVVTP
ncbi:MAG TPA: beta-propeller fold lactonase family protein [Gemmatimonadaceae bacterium]|jgi:6-phosphogluconolactonase (cycloisomerase 2 family)